MVLTLTVDDADATFARAIAAGATAQRPVALQFYGHRTGYLADPFGYRWAISTVVEELTPEEMQALGGQWYAWMQKFSGSILPGGDGLKPDGRLLRGQIVSDGPYVEAKEFVASFSLIQAENYDAALAIAREQRRGWDLEWESFRH